jgi:hypothetical protein
MKLKLAANGQEPQTGTLQAKNAAVKTIKNIAQAWSRSFVYKP